MCKFGIGMLLHKDFVGSVKDVDRTSRRVSGYLSTWDVKDHDGDIAVKGMFDKTVRERGPQGKNEIFFLNQHNWAQPHGKFAELGEDQKGLFFVSNKMPNTTFSNDVLELYSEGIIKEHSFGYEILNEEFDKEKDANMLLEVKLYEGSNVTLGANPNTPFTGFKSMKLQDLKERTHNIMGMIRNGTVTDETMQLLTIALKELQSIAYHMGKNEKEITKEPGHSPTLQPIDIKEMFNEVKSQIL